MSDQTRPIRVAQIRATTLRPWDLGNYQPTTGVDVEWFLSRRNAAEIGPLGVPVHALPSPGDVLRRLPVRGQAAVYLLAGSAEYLGGLERALTGFDVAHVIECYFPITLQAIRARDRGGCRVVVSTVMENIAFWHAQNALVRRRVQRIAAGVDHFVAISERARLHLETAGVPAERITVMPAGVDTDRFAPRGERATTGPLRILTVSRLERGKGVEDLATAIGLLAQRGIHAEATFVGQGPSAAGIEAIGRHYGVADRLHLTGAVPWERIGELHAEHDVFVLASAPTSNWREQFGFAVAEAMSSGMPVLVGDSGSLMEVAGRDDALVTPHDPLSLADRLVQLDADREQLVELGRFNRARALERFDARKVREALARLYRELLSARP